MKSVASTILAAVVSANYCYDDGCNCNGETRACYSVPRQNMRPQAINTCCPVGVQPTVYGIDNGRSINVTPVTDSLNWTNTRCRDYCQTTGAYPPMGCGQMTSPLSPYAEVCAPQTSSLSRACAQQMKADFNCSTIKTKDARKQCEKDKGDARKACEKGDADTRKESEKAAADDRKNSEKAAAEDRKNSEKAAAEDRKNSEKAAAEDRKNSEKAAAEARKNSEKAAAQTRKSTEKASADARKNAEKAKWGVGLNDLVACRDYSLFCCQEWNRFEWECLSQGLPEAAMDCPTFVAQANEQGLTPDSPGTCVHASLQQTVNLGCRNCNWDCHCGRI